MKDFSNQTLLVTFGKFQFCYNSLLIRGNIKLPVLILVLENLLFETCLIEEGLFT